MTTVMDLTPDEIETGRKLFAGEWRFVAGAGSPVSLPPMQGIEIAFAGRSNVGKSSLINALTSRKTLARISDTPGRTREVNFFAGPNGLVMVDLPGYGFARAPRDKIEAWTDLIRDYLLGRANLARVYVLIDARHGLKANDAGVLDALDGAAASYAIVLTKADQLKPGEAEARIAATADAIKRRPAAFPAVFATSARTGAGLPELRGAIIRLMAERRAS
ncbi:MAG TPA: ribosome biogenesis GTP-binding protein YihA/YsxC [Xanthobacteraceae bacterium]|nr:ribosome biogenesis GTP-binding protein YihA/YsxC [Xanthobacteraceae bacterium]